LKFLTLFSKDNRSFLLSILLEANINKEDIGKWLDEILRNFNTKNSISTVDILQRIGIPIIYAVVIAKIAKIRG
jgi:hypothetical protein